MRSGPLQPQERAGRPQAVFEVCPCSSLISACHSGVFVGPYLLASWGHADHQAGEQVLVPQHVNHPEDRHSILGMLLRSCLVIINP